jgi:iron-sulfur cluster assembly accessory protein
MKTLSKINENYQHLKIEIDSGGCSGFSYNLEMINSVGKEDIVFETNGVKILVDEITLDMINGSTIDYKEEMIRAAFEVSENPNAEMNCSCGTSFAPKGLN